MEQASRQGSKMIKSILLVLVAIFIAGCAPKPELSMQKFDKYTKDEVLNAAKKIFILADNENFIIDSYRNELNVTKFKAAHYGYKMDIVVDKLYFKAFSEYNSTRAELSMNRSYGVDESDSKLMPKSAHNIFWNRLNYLLGEDVRWETCTEYRLKMGTDNFFCDVTDIKNRLPKRSDILDLNVSRKKSITHEEKSDEPLIADTSKPDSNGLADINLSEVQGMDLVATDINKSAESNISVESSGVNTNTNSQEVQKNKLLDEPMILKDEVIPLESGVLEPSGTTEEGAQIITEEKTADNVTKIEKETTRKQ